MTAALRALLLFHGVSLADLGLEEAALPKLAWQVEEEELGIRAGLMDRLVQHAGGLLLMDFATAYLEAPYYSGRATRVRLELLPPLYLAYSLSSAGESGRVHAPVRRRFESRVCVCVWWVCVWVGGWVCGWVCVCVFVCVYVCALLILYLHAPVRRRFV